MSIPDATPPEAKAAGKGLAKRLGPFKLWQYGAILGGMILLWVVYKRRKSASGTATTSTLTTDTGTVDDPTVASYGDSSVAAGTSSSDDTTTASNATWGIQAANLLIGEGNDPLSVQAAISAYLNGQNPTTAQSALISNAIAQLGTPPQGVLPTAAAQSSVTYTVAIGDSLTSIAQEFYGDSSKWQTIYDANKSVIGSNPLVLHHGEILTLPGGGLLSSPGSGVTAASVPANHKYTIVYGDTIQQISEKFYGNATEAQAIYAANKKLITSTNGNATGVGLLPVGTTITLP